MAKIKTGKVSIPDEDFKDENILAHISLRLPLSLINDLKRLSLNPNQKGRYQTLIREILTDWVSNQTPKKKRA